ncbi:MAG TPA: Ig-like domain-containing protein, partial [Thermoanaerobaculia bacterium]
MARRASGGRVDVCVLLLGVALGTACARALPPPGGERDDVPPGVIAITPEPMSTIAPTDEPVVIEFDERISERDVEQAVYVSPATGPIDIGKGRRDLEISVAGGWQPNRVYRVVVRPTLRDLFDNPLATPIEIAFSTGAPFSDAALAGVVYERVTGTPVRDARVEAHPADGGAYHLALSDTAGVFRMPLLPPGSYLLRAYADQNRDRRRDEYEVGDSVMVEVGATDTVLRPLALMRADTSTARLTRVQVVDSVTLRLSFDDYMDVSAPQIDASVQVRSLPDSAIAPLAGIFYPHVFEAERARQDSIRADSIAAAAAAAAAADTTVTDSLRADTVIQPTQEPSRGPVRPDAVAADTAVADTMPVDPLTARVRAAELRPARDEPL